MYANMNKEDDGLLGKIQGLGGMIEGVSGMFGKKGSVTAGPLSMGEEVQTFKEGGKFKPHMMYDPKTKKSKKAMTYKEHLALKKKGWGHEVPKGQEGFETAEYMDLGFDIPEQSQYGNFGDNPIGGLFGQKKFSQGKICVPECLPRQREEVAQPPPEPPRGFFQGY